MAYRTLCAFLVLLWAAPSWAAGTKVALIVDGGGDRHDELSAALARTLGAELQPTASAPRDDAGLQALRASLGAARLVVVRVEAQGRDRVLLTADAVDAGGVAHRFGDGTQESLVASATKVVTELPPLPVPPEEAAPAPAAAAATPAPATGPPSPGVVPKPPDPPHASPSGRYYRRHPYDMLIAGALTFFIPYFVTVGLAASYQGYNANAARVGYIPLAGPFLARQRLSDKDLSDGYDPGLLADGIVQVLTANLLIAGIIYYAVGEKRLEGTHTAHVLPLIGVGQGEARLGAVVSW